MANVTIAPDADTEITGNWLPNTGATYYAVLDEASADDTDFILSGATPNQDRIKIRLSDPASAMNDPMTVAVRLKATSGTINIAIRLVENNTTIAEWLEEGIATTWTTVTHELSAGERASISDFTDLYVELEANPSADSTLLAGETDGMAVDFTVASVQVQTRASSADTFTNPQTFFTNAGTSPKYVASSTGIAWAPHNLIKQSQTYNDATWEKSNASVTADTTTAPDGTVTADTLTASGSTGYARQLYVSTAGFVVTVSVYAKKNNVDYVAFGLNSFSGNYAQVYFNLNSGTVGTTQSVGSVSIVASSITSIGSGWYRLSVSCFDINSGENLWHYAIPCQSDLGNSVNTDAVYLWGAQLNRGIVATEYIATTSAAVIGLPVSYGEGLLVEPAATNNAKRSEAVDNSYWTKTNLSIAADNTTAPDGSSTADKLTTTSTSFSHAGNDNGNAGANGVASGTGSWTGSIYAKAGTNAWIRVSVSDNVANSFDGFFDVGTGATGTGTKAGDAATPTLAIESVGGSWYRCKVTGSFGSGHTVVLDVGVVSGDNTLNATSGNNMWVWGAQLESGTVATSYIPTAAGTVVRATDAVKVATSAIGWVDATGSVVAWVSPRIVNNAAALRVVDFSDAATGNEVVSICLVTADTPDSYGLDIVDGGAAQVASGTTKTGAASTSGNKVAAAWQGNSAGIVVGGGSEVTDTSCSMPTPTSLSLGYSQVTAARELNGLISRVIYVPRRMSEADMQGKTT